MVIARQRLAARDGVVACASCGSRQYKIVEDADVSRGERLEREVTPVSVVAGGACQTQQQLIPGAHDRVNMKPAACTMNSHHNNDRQCFA
jgi:hypothetical protein